MSYIDDFQEIGGKRMGVLLLFVVVVLTAFIVIFEPIDPAKMEYLADTLNTVAVFFLIFLIFMLPVYKEIKEEVRKR